MENTIIGCIETSHISDEDIAELLYNFKGQKFKISKNMEFICYAYEYKFTPKEYIIENSNYTIFLETQIKTKKFPAFLLGYIDNLFEIGT